MAHGVVRLGPKDRPDLVDPFEDADQLLLEELRRLGEVGGPPEVVDLEDVRPRLGRGLDDLGGVDLGEPGVVEGRAEAAQGRGGELPSRPDPGVAPGHRRMVEQRRQPGRELGTPQLDGRGDRGLGERRDDRGGDLDTSGGLRVSGGDADHLDRSLLGWRLLSVGRPDDHLSQPAAVAQHQERHGGELATAVHVAAQPDGGAGSGRGELGGERTVYRFHHSSRWRGPGGVGGG